MKSIATNFRAMLSQLDNLVAEYGFFKTANLVTDAYELDMITAVQGRTLRFQLANRYEGLGGCDGSRFVGIDRVELPETLPETAHDAMFNRGRTDCTFDNACNGMTGHFNKAMQSRFEGLNCGL